MRNTHISLINYLKKKNHLSIEFCLEFFLIYIYREHSDINRHKLRVDIYITKKMCIIPFLLIHLWLRTYFLYSSDQAKR